MNHIYAEIAQNEQIFKYFLILQISKKAIQNGKHIFLLLGVHVFKLNNKYSVFVLNIFILKKDHKI
jgi:hypothetical protein